MASLSPGGTSSSKFTQRAEEQMPGSTALQLCQLPQFLEVGAAKHKAPSKKFCNRHMRIT